MYARTLTMHQQPGMEDASSNSLNGAGRLDQISPSVVSDRVMGISLSLVPNSCRLPQCQTLSPTVMREAYLWNKLDGTSLATCNRGVHRAIVRASLLR